MAKLTVRERRIRKQCRNRVNRGPTTACKGIGKVSLAKHSARVKTSGTAWSESYPRPKA